jgi:SAM-dependent methyltransferase
MKSYDVGKESMGVSHPKVLPVEIELILFACLRHAPNLTATGKLSVCEIECGEGRTYRDMLDTPFERVRFEYTGIDSSVGKIKRFHQRHPEARLFVADVVKEELPQIGLFDVVYLSSAYLQRHGIAEQEIILKVASSLLKGNGLVIADQYPQHYFSLKGALIDGVIHHEIPDELLIKMYDSVSLDLLDAIEYRDIDHGTQKVLRVLAKMLSESTSSELHQDVA